MTSSQLNASQETTEMKIARPQANYDEQPARTSYNWGHCVRYLRSEEAVCNYVEGMFLLGAAAILAYITHNAAGNTTNPKFFFAKNLTDVESVAYGSTLALFDLFLIGASVCGVSIIIKTCRKGCSQGQVRGNDPLLTQIARVNAPTMHH